MIAQLPNYYRLLGVLATASPEEIKAAYRKLAKALHPDRNTDTSAAEKFQAVVEAYETLSDPSKRSEYDAARTPATPPPPKPGVIEGVTKLVGGLVGELDRRWSLGQDLKYTVELGFVEACLGCEKTARFESPVRCPECRGRGDVPGGECAQCQGRGVVLGERVFQINVPPGTGPGTLNRIPGGGTPGERGGPEGDLTFVVSVRPHPLLERQDRNLRCRVPLPVTTALAGGRIEVPTLQGPAFVRVPAGVESGHVLRLEGRGLPRPDGGRGDLLITLDIELPEHLPETVRQLLLEAERQSPAQSYPRTHAYRSRMRGGDTD